MSPADPPLMKSSPAPENDGFRWVPVRTLKARNKPRVLQHLLALDEHDRYLRFGYVASDAQIDTYVGRIDFAQDEVFGVFTRRLELGAVAHLAYLAPSSTSESSAEFGVSVSARLRGRGIGARLFEHSMLHARNRGVHTLIIHALSENTPMLKIARRAGAVVERSGGDSDACLKLPPLDLASRLEEFVEDGAAEIDYSLKRRAQQIDGLMDTLAEASAQWIRPGKSGSE